LKQTRRPDVAVEAARKERKNRQNALIQQNEALQTALEQVTTKNQTLEEQLAKEKQRLKHELEEKEETVSELRLLKGELADLNDNLNALQVRNSRSRICRVECFIFIQN
jgi:septal ring factor EnvC (AmiA/AmiB activator)